MTDYFTAKYNYGFKLNQERLMNECIVYQDVWNHDTENYFFYKKWINGYKL